MREKKSVRDGKSFRTLQKKFPHTTEKKEERKKKHRKELDKQPRGNLEVHLRKEKKKEERKTRKTKKKEKNQKK